MSQRHTTPGWLGPADLVATALLGLWLLGPTVIEFGSNVRAVLGLLSVFFAPGYAFVAMLFPMGSATGPERDQSWSNRLTAEGGQRRLNSLLERVVLSVGLSVCIAPVLGLALNFTSWGLTRSALFGAVGGAALLFSGIAAVRRWQVPSTDRFSVPEALVAAADIDWIASRNTRSIVSFQVLLAGSLLLATAGLGAAVWHPTDDQSEEFTEFFVESEDPELGELGAAGYVPNESGTARLHLGITNHEGERTTYTVVTVLQRFTTSDGRRVLVSQQRLNTTSVTVAPGETSRFRHEFDGDVSGTNNRLTYLLYAGEPPSDPSTDDSYRDIHVWVDDS